MGAQSSRSGYTVADDVFLYQKSETNEHSSDGQELQQFSHGRSLLSRKRQETTEHAKTNSVVSIVLFFDVETAVELVDHVLSSVLARFSPHEPVYLGSGRVHKQLRRWRSDQKDCQNQLVAVRLDVIGPNTTIRTIGSIAVGFRTS